MKSDGCVMTCLSILAWFIASVALGVGYAYTWRYAFEAKPNGLAIVVCFVGAGATISWLSEHASGWLPWWWWWWPRSR